MHTLKQLDQVVNGGFRERVDAACGASPRESLLCPFLPISAKQLKPMRSSSLRGSGALSDSDSEAGSSGSGHTDGSSRSRSAASTESQRAADESEDSNSESSSSFVGFRASSFRTPSVGAESTCSESSGGPDCEEKSTSATSVEIDDLMDKLERREEFARQSRRSGPTDASRWLNMGRFSPSSELFLR